MFNSFTEVVLSKKRSVLPPIALKHALLNRKVSIASLTSYANSLRLKYPEQYDLINDIVDAGLNLSVKTEISELQEQLIDLELYLIDTE